MPADTMPAFTGLEDVVTPADSSNVRKPRLIYHLEDEKTPAGIPSRG